MATTSVHLPPDVVEQLDRLANRRGTSRNRIIVEACQRLLDAQRGEWPQGFFESELTEEDEALLRDAGLEMEQAVYHARRNRQGPPL